MILPIISILVSADSPLKISTNLFGIFFEDLNYAADGGLYAELVQNRSFEYTNLDHQGWDGLTSWTVNKSPGSEGRANIRSGSSLHHRNPHYVSLFVEKGTMSLSNSGFDGILLRKGELYDFSMFARVLSGNAGTMSVRLEDDRGNILASKTLASPSDDWQSVSATLSPSNDTNNGRLVVSVTGPGATGMDMISLFPGKTFRNRKNGLRADLAQTIADLHPKFVRFPGGCIVHGGWLGTSNFYDWKKTVGPVETRQAQPNQWGYHQTTGIGYFEYFQFCEDIGAKPLPVVPAAVSCQNTDYNWGKGQEAIPLAEMKTYIQDVLDLVEYANGPSNSKWGKIRAQGGHPKPFNLEYLAIGNEEAITPLFESRFKMIHDAVRSRYPKLKLIGTVGPFADGSDFDAGWKFTRKEKLGFVDEHYYLPPNWFWDNLHRYDAYDRLQAHVYAGEYAAHEEKRENTLRSALAEAAHLTSLERNGDVVQLSSYAPLLAKQGHTQWRPDLIYFDNQSVQPSINYEVQRLFMMNAGDEYLPVKVAPQSSTLATSVVRDTTSGDVIVKIVSRADTATKIQFDFSSLKRQGTRALQTTLSGKPLDQNIFGQVPAVKPIAKEITIGSGVSEFTVPANSLTVLRIRSR